MRIYNRVKRRRSKSIDLWSCKRYITINFESFSHLSEIYILIENLPFSALCNINWKFSYPCDINPKVVYFITHPFPAIFDCYYTPLYDNYLILWRIIRYVSFNSDLQVWHELGIHKHSNVYNRQLYRQRTIC